MIVRGEAYATKEAPLLNMREEDEPITEEEVVETELKSVSNGQPVLSFADKVALHKQKQAEKKALEEK